MFIKMQHSPHRPYDRVAHVMAMTAGAVRKLVHDATTSPPSTPPTSPAPPVFDNFTVGAIRRFIHRKFVDKKHFTDLQIVTTSSYIMQCM